MKELLQYSEHDAFRDAVNDDGDVVPISDLFQPEIDELAVQRGRDLGVKLREESVTTSQEHLREQPDPSVYHGPQYGEEEGVGYPNGQPHYYEPLHHQTEEERKSHEQGMAMARRVLNELKEKPQE